MKMLKSHNLYAAVNTVSHPAELPVRLTIGELAQPAVLRYEGFPLFIREPIRKIQSQDIAFNLFFGRPVFIVEHHEVFQRPEALIDIATRINSVAPGIHWSNLSTVVSNSVLMRKVSDGSYEVRAYSGTVRISNDSQAAHRYSLEWGGSCDGALIERLEVDGAPCHDFEIDSAGVRLSVELAPGSLRTFSLIYRNDRTATRGLGPRWKARAFLRRRLSELRDNHLSKNQRIFVAAKSFQRRFLKI
jgi:hypothetical protein